jgi:hypothetical protein
MKKGNKEFFEQYDTLNSFGNSVQAALNEKYQFCWKIRCLPAFHSRIRSQVLFFEVMYKVLFVEMLDKQTLLKR